MSKFYVYYTYTLTSHQTPSARLTETESCREALELIESVKAIHSNDKNFSVRMFWGREVKLEET